MKWLLVAALLALGGCGHHGSGHDAGVDMAFVPAFAAHANVDILFVIADFTILPKRQELLNRFPQLVKALDSFAAQGSPASYHIGVITSDLGAGPFTYNSGQCHPDGDGAKLQVTASSASPLVPAACANFNLSGGVRYIDYNQIAGANNLVGVPDVPTAFTCMASINDGGCPYFQTLEAAYRALSNPPPENAGFLRDDALLVIVFLQDTDDCSAPLDSPVFDLSQDPAVAGSFKPMRCAHAGVACGMPSAPLNVSASGGPFDDCRPLTQAEGGQLYDVQRYIDFFARPGGVKADPSDVILDAIAAPPSPFGWSINTCYTNAPCPNLNHSCIAPSNAVFFADPAVRLAAVVGAGYTSQQDSICATDDSPAFEGLAQKIIARLQ